MLDSSRVQQAALSCGLLEVGSRSGGARCQNNWFESSAAFRLVFPNLSIVEQPGKEVDMFESVRRFALVIFLMMLVLPHASAESDEPEWFPAPGEDLIVTLDSVHNGRRAGHSVSTRDFEIVRVDVTPWQPVSEQSLRSDGPAAGSMHAVVALQTCRSAQALHSLQPVQRNWYLFSDDHLVAYDHHFYNERCSSRPYFRPAPEELVDTERRLVAWIDEKFGKQRLFAAELYAKGLWYVVVGRLDDAEAMLAAGESGLSLAVPVATREQRKLLEQAKAINERLRDQLAAAIPLAEARIANGEPPVDPAIVRALTPERPLTAADREQLAQRAVVRDRKNAQRWEREKNTRLFRQLESGWMLVDENRRKRGPRKGEKWVTYEEMLAIKAATPPE